MSDRFIAWIAQEAASDERRLLMALVGVGIVFAWECIRHWPQQWRRTARIVFVSVGGLSYAAIFAVGLYALARLVAFGR